MLTLAAGACAPSSLTDLSGISLLPSTAQFSRPDWLTYSGGKEEFTLRPVTAADLVSQDGQCAMTVAEAAPAPDADPNAPQAAPLAAGGIALQMTECDVVRRAGPPEQLQIGADERGDRAVVITYVRGPRPGIYSFAGGRLKSVERAPGAPAERPQKGKAKKAARS
jgi:hypothetical protein